MGRCKSLGSLKSFLSYVSQLSWAGSYFFPHPELPGAHHREWLQPEAARPQACFSFLSALRAQKLTSEHCKRWGLWHACLLIWQEISHFSIDKYNHWRAFEQKRFERADISSNPLSFWYQNIATRTSLQKFYFAHCPSLFIVSWLEFILHLVLTQFWDILKIKHGLQYKTFKNYNNSFIVP